MRRFSPALPPSPNRRITRPTNSLRLAAPPRLRLCVGYRRAPRKRSHARAGGLHQAEHAFGLRRRVSPRPPPKRRGFRPLLRFFAPAGSVGKMKIDQV